MSALKHCWLLYRLYLTLICYSIYATYPLQANQWSQSANLSVLGQNASHPQIAIDSFGNAIAVWYRFDDNHLIIQASTKPFGSNWQAIPDNLSLPDQDAFNPQIVIDSFGNATVVWERFNGSHLIIQASTKPFGGRWQGIPDNLSHSGQNASAPQVAVDSFGNVTVVWQCFDDSHSIIQTSTKPFGGSWQALPNNLSLPGQNATCAQIVIDQYETTTVVWQCHGIIQVSTKPFRGNWQRIPDNVSLPGQNAFHPQIVVDFLGNLTVVWNQFNGNYGIIQASTKPFGDFWQAVPDNLSLPDQNAFSPQIAVDAFDNVTAVWECFDENKLRCIHASTKPFGESWQAVSDHLSLPGDHNVNPQIAIDASGNTVVVWNNYKGFTGIHVSVKPFGGNWQAVPDIISSPGRSAFFPQIAFSPFGQAIAIWVMQDSLSFIQAADNLCLVSAI